LFYNICYVPALPVFVSDIGVIVEVSVVVEPFDTTAWFKKSSLEAFLKVHAFMSVLNSIKSCFMLDAKELK
jgi:hypothetical protein